MDYVKDGQPTSEPDTIRQALRPVRELYGDARAGDFGPLAQARPPGDDRPRVVPRIHQQAG